MIVTRRLADGASRNQIRRFGERLKGRVAMYIRDVVTPALGSAAYALAADGQHDIRIGDDGETIRFAYPSAVEDPHGHVRSEVLLEFGGRNVIDPNEQHEIAPDMVALTRGLDYPAATVTVLSPARTFWEKATLVHVECHRRRLAEHPERLSRHWFDLTRLAAHNIGRTALADRELLEDVVRHKGVFFHAGYANYDHCLDGLDGRLRLVPDDDQLPGLQADYDAMRAAAIVADDAPEFDALVEEIRILGQREPPPLIRTATGSLRSRPASGRARCPGAVAGVDGREVPAAAAVPAGRSATALDTLEAGRSYALAGP